MEFKLRKIGMEQDTLRDLPRADPTCRTASSWSPARPARGKTTTLYSALLEIKDDETQDHHHRRPGRVSARRASTRFRSTPKIGLTFGHSLRSILRHDPDIVLVGEIRDLETAENAIQASLTGHLVFSTLHTNDAAGAYTRLIDMGVEPFLVASTVEAVMAQRLVRVLCTQCKEAVPAQARRAAARLSLGAVAGGGRRLCTGPSAAGPAGRSATGRMGIFELLVTTDRGPPAGPRPRQQLGDQAGRRRPTACAPCARTAGTRCSPAAPRWTRSSRPPRAIAWLSIGSADQ